MSETQKSALNSVSASYSVIWHARTKWQMKRIFSKCFHGGCFVVLVILKGSINYFLAAFN
jgi:hypothetical protein